MKIGHDSGQCRHEAENVNKTFGPTSRKESEEVLMDWTGRQVARNGYYTDLT
jgi:hypothetical protein